MLPTRKPKPYLARFRPAPPIYQLLFVLPHELRPVAPGRHQPAEDGPVLTIDPAGLVHISGRNRVEVLGHASRFLRQIGKGRPPCTVVATYVGPAGEREEWVFSLMGEGAGWGLNASPLEAKTG